MTFALEAYNWKPRTQHLGTHSIATCGYCKVLRVDLCVHTQRLGSSRSLGVDYSSSISLGALRSAPCVCARHGCDTCCLCHPSELLTWREAEDVVSSCCIMHCG